MALSEKQLIALRKAAIDEDSIESIFPEQLSPADWKLVVDERESVLKTRSQDFLLDRGAAWEKEGRLLTERRRNRPLKDFATNAVPILMQTNGGGWVADPLLWYLAHKQFRIDRIRPMSSGYIPNEQLIHEFKEKIWGAIRFAKPYVEPLQLPASVVCDYQKNPLSIEEYRKLMKALKSAPRPKHPQRNNSAESLLNACENVLKELESHEKKLSPTALANWCHLMSQVFEAGKAHAYLERDRDPQTLAENRQGARMIGTPMSRERRTMEEGCDEFERKHGRRPNSKELQAHLGVVIKKSSGSDGRDDELKFRGHKIARKDFQRRFDDIRRYRKNEKR